MMKSLSITALLPFCLLATRSASAQERQVLADASNAHAVSVHEVARLDFEGLDVAPDVLARVFRLPKGGWGVSDRAFPGMVQLFDSSGTPSGKFGRSGQGPGELGGEVFAVAMNDQLWVVDPGNSRLSFFDEDLTYIGDRRLAMRPVIWIAPARDGKSLLVSGSTFLGHRYYAIERVSPEANADAVGSPLGEQPLQPSRWLIDRREAVETRDGEVWSVSISGGEIDVLAASNLALEARLRIPGKEMAREAPWALSDFDERPAPQLAGVSADSSGMLLLVFAVADRQWKPGLDPRQAGVDVVFDTRVLVINPVKRAITARVQFDPICSPMTGNLLSCTNELAQEIRVIELRM